ncbi:MAG: hypothetical protein K2H43_06655 [Clostridia bacterium]|nr:hypothetical protein [Clostridia bacterium]
MKKKTLRRIAAIASSAVLCAGACVMFAGCTTNNPEITITYTFQGKDYAVDYRLSRLDAPKTVVHFLELADAGYYDGTCVHDYDGLYFYMGGYTLEDGELTAKDYFSEVKKLEAEKKITFTQSVWKNDEAMTPLYTVYGEFDKNGNRPQNGREMLHDRGALVMYYTDKGNFNEQVVTLRNDGGKNNDGDKYDRKSYNENSATSLFYTYTGDRLTDRENNYCVFGKAIDFSDDFQPLLDAITEYISDHTDEDSDSDYSFTTERTIRNVNENEQPDDPDFAELRRGDIEATYNVPVEEPIVIKSVKVKKY